MQTDSHEAPKMHATHINDMERVRAVMKEENEGLRRDTEGLRRAIEQLADAAAQTNRAIAEMAADRLLHNERFNNIARHQNEQDERLDHIETRIESVREDVALNRDRGATLWKIGAGVVSMGIGGAYFTINLFYELIEKGLTAQTEALVDALVQLVKVLG